MTDETHGSDLDDHFESKEREDCVVERVENSTSHVDTGHVVARLKHPQRDTVEQDYRHTDPLKPCTPDQQLRNTYQRIISYHIISYHISYTINGRAVSELKAKRQDAVSII